MPDANQFDKLTAKVDKFQSHLSDHQMADEKAHSAMEKQIVTMEGEMIGVVARLDAHSKSLETISAGVDEICEGMRGLDSITDGLLREQQNGRRRCSNECTMP